MKFLLKRMLLKARSALKPGIFAMLGVVFVVGLLLMVADHASAQETLVEIATSTVKDIIAFVVNLYVFVVGALITSLLVPLLTGIAQYNDFMTNPVVTTGWALTRDLANMFFIVVLLIIAFSTMLRIQTYHYKQMLSKFVVMIVLINFSQVIAGVLIDFFQVIMLTFVNGFAHAVGGNFIYAFHIYEMLAMASGTGPGGTGQLQTGAVSDLAVIGGLILAAVALTVVALTIMIMIVVLLYRIVMLWILIVLSPLAYFAYTIRPNYWTQWWSEFFKHLISGPVIAFFLWLTLLTVSATPNLIPVQEVGGEVTLVTEFSKPNIFINYLTTVALMIAGLIASQKIANQSGAAVGNIAGKIRSVGTKAALGLGGVSAAKWLAKKPVGAVSRRWQAYQSAKESIKQQKAQEFAAGAMRVKGKVKQATVGNLGKYSQKAFSAITLQKQRDDASAKITELKQRRKELRAKGDNRTEAENRELKQVGSDLTKQRLKLRASQAVGIGGAAVVASALGGLPAWGAAGIAAMTATKRGRRATFGKLSQMGKRELSYAKFQKLNDVDKEQKEMANKSKTELQRAADDSSLTRPEQTAAIMELMKRGEADSKDVARYRRTVEDLNNKDEAVMGRFNTFVDDNYSADRTPKQKKEDSNAKRAYDGRTTLSNQSSDTLERETDEFMRGHLEAYDKDTDTYSGDFNLRKFNAEFEKMSDEQQQAVVGKAHDTLFKLEIPENATPEKEQEINDVKRGALRFLISQARFDKIPLQPVEADYVQAQQELEELEKTPEDKRGKTWKRKHKEAQARINISDDEKGFQDREAARTNEQIEKNKGMLHSAIENSMSDMVANLKRRPGALQDPAVYKLFDDKLSIGQMGKLTSDIKNIGVSMPDGQSKKLKHVLMDNAFAKLNAKLEQDVPTDDVGRKKYDTELEQVMQEIILLASRFQMPEVTQRLQEGAKNSALSDKAHANYKNISGGKNIYKEARGRTFRDIRVLDAANSDYSDEGGLNEEERVEFIKEFDANSLDQMIIKGMREENDDSMNAIMATIEKLLKGQIADADPRAVINAAKAVRKAGPSSPLAGVKAEIKPTGNNNVNQELDSIIEQYTKNLDDETRVDKELARILSESRLPKESPADFGKIVKSLTPGEKGAQRDKLQDVQKQLAKLRKDAQTDPGRKRVEEQVKKLNEYLSHLAG